jgi:hypothetical protein
MTAFFLIHGLLVLLERLLRQRSWPRWAQRSWTLGWLAISSPLFVEPLLAVFVGH